MTDIVDTTAKARRARLESEVKRRRTFAIISHPDAGKTTLTEKLLLASGMIRTAGVVRARKGDKSAASDWMKLERERGISITASAMQFHYKSVTVNLLDTPGHQDFSEDTYRTLAAADSVIMVLDAAKGVEAQTRKLFDACRLRAIPVLTFINKMDMPGREPLDLMTEVEEVLGILSSPLNWPIGSGKSFRGLVDRQRGEARLYTKRAARGSLLPDVHCVSLAGLAGLDGLSTEERRGLEEELELLKEAGNPFRLEDYRAARVTPVFFGSALTNYGIDSLFDAFIDLAPWPQPRIANLPDGTEVRVEPEDENFSAFVFKLQANMNPRHRDCVAFLRINSGVFEKDMQVKHPRTGRRVRLSAPHSLLVSQREMIEEAFPGDVIGVINPGVFSIGDTLTVNGEFIFDPLPQFQPEVFARLRPLDHGKRKAVDKGLKQLASEGAVQILREWDDSSSFPLIAAVGRLQFEVMQYRLKDEYGAATELDRLPYECSAWLLGDVASFAKPSGARVMKDQLGRPLVLFTSQWEKEYARRNNPDLELVDYG